VTRVVVIGGGIVGLATAYEITRTRPHATVTVVEKENRVAAHQTGHNSGVIHAGVYYKPGSLKARLCRTGSQSMVDFCTAHGIPVRVCGKLIVATEPSELPRLDAGSADYTFTTESVDRVFNFVTLEAYGAGLWSDKVTELAATSRRLASCSLRRGATDGTIKVWDLPYALICEVSDDTVIDDVLAGRRALVTNDRDGLSSANRKCDLVQLRSTGNGTTVRLHMWK